MNFSKKSNWTKTIVMFLVTMTIISCKDTKNKAEAKLAEEVKEVATEAINYQVDTESAIVAWKGSKKVGDTHHGTIQISEGYLALKDGKLSGGNFVIDMGSIKNVDIEDAGYNKKLTDHLNGSDFFDVAKHPTATFEITDVNYEVGMDMVKGNLTIKGITKSIEIPATTTLNGEEEASFKSMTFTIDRTEWDVKYNSGKFFDDLKDKLINDDIEFTINLVAKK